MHLTIRVCVCFLPDDRDAWLHPFPVQGMLQGPLHSRHTGTASETLQLSNVRETGYVQQGRHPGDVRAHVCFHGEPRLH